MTSESITWLNENVLTGFGHKPWHFVEGVSTEPFAGAVPLEAVAGLFPTIEERPEAWLDKNGQIHLDDSKKRLVNSKTEQSLAVVGARYGVHQYIDTMGDLGLPTVSAGVLKGGAMAWQQYGSADLVTTPENVQFTTKLLVATSCDGSLATQYRWVTTLAVCDNTLAMAVTEGEHTMRKVRHTFNSMDRVEVLRREYGLIEDRIQSQADDIALLTSIDLTDATIDAFLNRKFDPKGNPKDVPAAAVTRADTRKAGVYKWLNGTFADYSNTAFGVLQALDSERRWESTPRGRTTSERVSDKILWGSFDKAFAQDRLALAGV